MSNSPAETCTVLSEHPHGLETRELSLTLLLNNREMHHLGVYKA